MSDINIGAISEALNNKTDRNMRNVDTASKADSVIDFQEPTTGNGYTWYRKYASGWVEQGGLCATSTGNTTVTLPVVMANNQYTTSADVSASTSLSGTYYVSIDTKTTTSIRVKPSTANGIPACWQVSGMAA